MKLIFIIGSGAVGKMTVGQELAKITGLRLFHNHMAIEQVVEIFGYYDGKAVTDLRDAVFKNFAASKNYGMIFTYMWAFDRPEDWAYIEHVRSIFEPYGTEFYCVELVAPQEIRLQRNTTSNRLENKPTKRDAKFSSERIVFEDANYRLVSRDGELPFENYLKIDNSDLSAADVAAFIKLTFNL